MDEEYQAKQFVLRRHPDKQKKLNQNNGTSSVGAIAADTKTKNITEQGGE